MQDIPYREATLEQLAARLESRKRKAAVLIGAGVSLSAGIPLGAGIADEAVRRYAAQTQGCELHDYASAMDRLTPAERNDILEPLIRGAKINAAHLYLADLVREGFVDLILSTNFDPLATQGLTYSNVTHYVYDVANLGRFEVSLVRTPAVLYLHGQFGAFVNIHSDEEAKRVRLRVQQTYDNFLADYTVIVVGYGGDPDDPVFNELCQRQQFNCGLYWVRSSDAEPPTHVLERLLKDKTRYAYYTRNQPADAFFARLAARLGVKSRNLILHPFTFLSDALERVAEVKPEQDARDLTVVAREQAAEAQRCFEDGKLCTRVEGEILKERVLRRAQVAALEENFGDLDSIAAEAEALSVDQARPHLARGYAAWGRTLHSKAVGGQQNAAEGLLREAAEKYNRAVKLAPDDGSVYFQWGDTLDSLGRILRGPERLATFREAWSKYELAQKLGYKEAVLYRAWASTLSILAPLLPEAEALLATREECEKLRRATELDPSRATWLNFLGGALLRLWRAAPPDESDAILGEASSVLERAELNKPGVATYNMACLAAVRGDKDTAFRLLTAVLATGQGRYLETARTDLDFETLRADDRWQALLNNYQATRPQQK